MSEGRPFARFYEAVARIPPGKVATYGDVAEAAGFPRGGRQAGWALRALPEGSAVPWWRVIRRDGRIALTGADACRQAERLRAEGVAVSEEGRVDLERYRWDGQ